MCAAPCLTPSHRRTLTALCLATAGKFVTIEGADEDGKKWTVKGQTNGRTLVGSEMCPRVSHGASGATALSSRCRRCASPSTRRRVAMGCYWLRVPAQCLPRAGDLLLDFSAKGGPKDVLARADSIGITFPDGNVWKKQL